MPAYQRPPATPPRIVLGGDTDPLLKKAAEAADTDEITDPGREPPGRSRVTPMGVLLVAALAASLLVSLVLLVKLQRVRDDLADAEAAQHVATEAAAPPAPPDATSAVVAEGTPDILKPELPKSPPAAKPKLAAAPPERLLLLVTVGTQHFAEKQLRELKRKCKAPLAVYQQKGGRCAWSTCYAVAAAEADADLARNCGGTKGESLREKKDFVPVQSNR